MQAMTALIITSCFSFRNLILALEQEQCRRVTVVSGNARRGQSIAELPSILENLHKNHQVRVVFLNADTNTLVQRFSETRRRHPLSTNAKQSQSATLIEAIDKERNLLEPLRAQAHSIDTSNIPAHALRSGFWIFSEANLLALLWCLNRLV